MKSHKIKIYQSIHILEIYFHQEFCIDFDDNKIIPIEVSEPYNPKKNPLYGEKIYYLMLDDIFDYNYYLHDKFCDNSIKNEYTLSDKDSKRLLNFFNAKNLSEGILAEGHSQFSIDAEADIRYNISSEYWADLNNILKDITSFDVLNLGHIISQSNYDFKNDGIYLKSTSEKLKLKKLCFYNRDGSWLRSDPMIVIDIDENKIRGCIDKDLSNDELYLILNLLKKYDVYRWNFNDLWRNTNEIPHPIGFGGRVWELELIFEDDKVFAISGGGDYPDTYVQLGEEILDIFDIDVLRLDYIGYNEVYKKYGDKHLNQK